VRFEQVDRRISVSSSATPTASSNSDNTLTQFFIRDPDGYYIELCNCDILTDFCFNRIKCPKREQRYTTHLLLLLLILVVLRRFLSVGLLLVLDVLRHTKMRVD
jgi:hypothetical protein